MIGREKTITMVSLDRITEIVLGCQREPVFCVSDMSVFSRERKRECLRKVALNEEKRCRRARR